LNRREILRACIESYAASFSCQDKEFA
jgi:hypothetical protein